MKLFKSRWWGHLIVFAALTGILYFLTYTSAGLKQLIKFASIAFPGKIEAELITGRLLGPIHLQKLKIHLKDTDISCDQLDIEWEPVELLKGKLHIIRLYFSKPKILLQSNTTSLPSTLNDKINSSNNSNHSPQVFLMQFQQYFNKISIDKLQIDELDLQKQQNRFQINGSIDNQWNIQWSIDATKLQNFSTTLEGIVQGSGYITGARYLPVWNSNFVITDFKREKNRIKLFNFNTIFQLDLKGKWPIKKFSSVMQGRNIQLSDYKIPDWNAEFAIYSIPEGYKGIAKIKSTNFIYPINDTQKSFTLPAIESTLLWNAEALQSQITTKNSPNEIITALSLPGFNFRTGFSPSQAIKSNINVNLSNLNILQPFFPNLQNLQGQLQLHATANGTIATLHFNGQAKLTNASMFIPDAGIQLRGMQIEAKGDSLEKIVLTGHALSDSGYINITGTSRIEQGNPSTILSMTGKNFLIYRIPRYEIYASPEVTIEMDKTHLKLTGNLAIPKARLSPLASSNDIAVIPNDVVIIGEKAIPQPPSEVEITTDINLRLEDKVNLQLLGLTSRLKGDLHIISSPHFPTLATGELSIIDGQYHAYGQNLNIRKGARLSYVHSPIENPAVYLQAIRTINTIAPNATQSSILTNTLFTTPPPNSFTPPPQASELVVGIMVKGNVQDPQLSLFSEPANLSQADILSYILLGQPLNEASNQDAQLLLKAAAALNPGEGQLTHIVQQLQHSFGLDELKVQSIPQLLPGSTTVTQNTSLVLGKRLSNRLYINYSVGLSAPLNILKISYILGSKWKLQTESSNTANALDLFYTIEKN